MHIENCSVIIGIGYIQCLTGITCSCPSLWNAYALCCIKSDFYFQFRLSYAVPLEQWISCLRLEQSNL